MGFDVAQQNREYYYNVIVFINQYIEHSFLVKKLQVKSISFHQNVILTSVI